MVIYPYLHRLQVVHRPLLESVAFSHVQLFTAEAVATAVECWQWLLAARPDLEFCFLQQMATAWQFTFEKRMGVFGGDAPAISPLAAGEHDSLRPQRPSVDAHDVWIRFLIERVDIAKYCSQDQVRRSLLPAVLATTTTTKKTTATKALLPFRSSNSSFPSMINRTLLLLLDAQVTLFAQMLHATLPFDVGSRCPRMSRHPAACGTRFRLLHCGLSLLQVRRSHRKLEHL